MKKMSALKGALIASVAMGAMPITAWAQSAAAEEAEPAEEMVVIGQRQQYRGDVPLSAIPQSVQVIDAKTLQDLNITRFDAALDLSSGVSRQNNFGGMFDGFAIRGFSGDEDFPGGVLVNGFNGGRGYGGTRDASNIEKIEILKGPNGAVFGRGEPGGTINIITKKAKIGETFGSFALQGGSFNTYRVEGDYNLAISDTLAIRVNGAVQDGDSFRDTIHQTLYVATPSILFSPSKDTSVSYEMEFVNNRIPFDRGVLAFNGRLGAIPNSRFLGEPGDGPMRINVLGHQLQFQQKLGGSWYFLAGLGYRETEFAGASTEAELDPVGANRRQTLGKPSSFLARQRRTRDYDTTNIVVRAEISGNFDTGSIKHHFLLGADWDRFRINLLQLRGRPANGYVTGSPITAANNAVDIFNPVYGQILPVSATPLTNSVETQKAWGIYLQDQIDLSDRFKLRLGGRYDNFRQSFVLGPSVLRTNTVTTSRLNKRFSPTVGLLYELNDSLAIYAGYGRGFRPNSNTDATDTPFAAELSKSYEVGLRVGKPGDVISGSIAAFTMNKDNVKTADPRNANFSIVGGAARSRGVELDINASLPGDINVIATYAYLDAVWTTSSLDKDFGFTINAGDPLINIPNHAANLIVSKGFEVGGQSFTLGGGLNYVGERSGETASTFNLPGYVLTRLMGTWQPSDTVRFTADVTNLFDKQFYSASYSSFWIAPGAPRAFNVRATFSF